MIELARWISRCLLAACALGVGGWRSDCARGADDDRVSLQLRMEWGGGPARRWRGTVENFGCRLEAPMPLGIEPDEPGSMYLADGRLQVEPRSPRGYDGVDFAVEGVLAHGKLIVELAAADAVRPSRHEIPLKQLIDEPFYAALDDAGNRLAIRRAPGDRLRVRIERSSLIFASGETLALQVRPHRLGLEPQTKLLLTTTVRPARQTAVLSTQSWELAPTDDDDAWPTALCDVRLPAAEGVYDVVLEAARRDLSSRLLRQTTVERRTVQVVVLAESPPPRHDVDPAAQPLLVEIDPASPGWWERMKPWALPTAVRRGLPGNAQPAKRTHIDGGYVELPPTREPEEPAWQAYPLPAARPGAPHVVELEYPANVAQSLGVSLVEPNASGGVAPLGVDLGLHVDEADVEATAARRVKRFVVWPRTAAPLLVVMNRSRTQPAVYGKIRLLGPRSAPAAYRPWVADETPTLPAAVPPELRSDGRLVAAYWDKPLLAENFGATTAATGDAGSRCLHDWVTFYDGARRLVEYLQFAGYNGLILTVAADGSAIYPSRLLQPTPRYDDGTQFGTGQDPLRKDVVELLLRMCDRAGLRFVPAVQFTAPLPRLEDERRAGNRGLAPLGLDGFAWNDVHPPAGGLGPYYQPLRPRVQEEMHAVVAELIERYGGHPSFAGVSIPLSAEGYTQLPGIEWGLDPQTVAEFYRATNHAMPEEPAAAAARVLDRHRAAWIAWRQARLTRFYAELAEQAGAARGKLYLTAVHAWERPDLQRRLQPSLPAKNRFDPILHESGIDGAALAALPHVEWLRSYRESPPDDPARQATNLELNRDATLDRLDPAGGSAVRGALIFHEPQPLRLESLERQSPFQPAEVRLAAQPTAGGAAARRALVHALAAHDAATVCHGGWLLPLGAHDEVRRVAVVLRQLPAAAFTTLAGLPSHVTARTLAVDGRTYFYVVNDAPWPTTVKLVVERSSTEPCRWNSFLDDGRTGWSSTGPTYRWQAALEPYDVAAGYFTGDDVKPTSVQVVTAPEIADRIERRIDTLWARFAQAQRQPGRVDLTNSHFGQAAKPGEPPPGWTLEGDASIVVEPMKVEGRVVLTARGGEVRLTSSSFVPPPNGRLRMSVGLRSNDERTPQLRWAVVGQAEGRPYYRYTTLGGRDPNAPQLSRELAEFVFALSDLPQRGPTDLRVCFELLEPGRIDIQNLRLAVGSFSDVEALELTKAISSAEHRLQHGELGECARVLDGYWPRYLTAYVPLPAGQEWQRLAKPEPAAGSAPPAAVEAGRRWRPSFLR